MIRFDTLREANIARQAEWDAGNSITLLYRAIELAGEAGEACNLVKKLERERLGIRGSRANLSELAAELADVIICCDLIAMQAGIDLAVGDSACVVVRSDAMQAAADMMLGVGQVCDSLKRQKLAGLSVTMLHCRLDLVVGATREIARHHGILVNAAVCEKFNGTSEKVGLATRLVDPKEAA